MSDAWLYALDALPMIAMLLPLMAISGNSEGAISRPNRPKEKAGDKFLGITIIDEKREENHDDDEGFGHILKYVGLFVGFVVCIEAFFFLMAHS